MAEQFKNLASTTLSDGIDDSVTSITVASAMGFTSGEFRILIDSEIMKVTGVSGTTLTVARGQEGTAAASHTSSTAVYHILTAGALDAHDQNDMAAYNTFANRPAAGTPGRIFLPTDGLFIERDNGSIWEKFGPIWPMTPPLAADFPTWLNQGSSTFTDIKGAIFFNCVVATSATIRGRVKTYPSTPFTVEMACLPNTIAYGSSSDVVVGLCIRDSGTGKFQCYGPGGYGYNMGIKGYSYSSYTASATSITGWPADQHYSESALCWLKYADNGTNRVISTSVDGYTWTQLVSLTSADYLTPNQIGICAQAKSGYSGSTPYFNIDTGITVLHWRQY
ncbi:MAG: hypothetical protein ACYC35_00615 [Pirellulales bacterium]